MAGSMNKVMLIGFLGQDPEVRTFQNGSKVVNLRIATSETWTDRASGERRERTEWHSVAIFAEHQQKVAEQYLRKGSQVCIEGKLETRKWQDQSGADRYSTEVVLRPYGGELIMLGKAGDGSRDGGGSSRGGAQQGQGSRGSDNRQGNRQGQQQGYSRSDMDDEIPF